MEEIVEFEEVEEQEEFSTMDELSPQFIRSPKVGETVNILVKGFKIVKDKSVLEFTFDKNGKQKKASNALSSVDYGIQLITDSNAVFWISSWAVWGQTKAIAKKLESKNLAGIELEISHPLNGMIEENREKECWIVKAKVSGEFKKLGRETNEWE